MEAELNPIDIVKPAEVDKSTKPGDEFSQMFLPDLEAAIRKARQIMLNTPDDKLALSAAESIMDRAGATRKVERAAKAVVNISDSNVMLLVQATKEALE